MSISWPGVDDDSVKHPFAIEKFLKETIQNSQVTLLGELDLNIPVNYGGTDWSLAQLAEYLIEKPLIVSKISKSNTEVMEFAATIAIWAVARAQNLDTGTELWTNSGFEGSKLTKLPEKFTQSIEFLGLESFNGLLEGRQRHISLARLHAMIPVYATTKFVEVVKNSHKYLRAKETLLHRILENDSVSEAVKLLCELEPEIALDLLDRCLQVLSTGKSAGLPDRLTNALLNNYKVDFKARGKALNFPVILFSEATAEVFFNAPSNWKIENNGQVIDREDLIQPGITRGIDSQGFTYKLLDTSKGYLVFNFADQMHIDSTNIPSDGIFILWNNELEVSSESLASEIFPLYGWNEWSWAITKPSVNVTLTNKNGKVHRLNSKKSLQIKESRIRFLSTLFGEDIFNEWPEILPNQVVKVINNEDGSQMDIGLDGGIIGQNISGSLDFQILGGLGKTRNISGLVIPGLRVLGLDTPLISGEKRMVSFEFPKGWDAPKQLEVQAVNSDKLPYIVATSPNGNEHVICVNLPILNWTLEMNDGTSIRMQKTQKFKLKDIAGIQSLVLHEIPTGSVPTLYIVEKSKNSTAARKPLVHDHDARVDLRTIKDSAEKLEIKLEMNWNGGRLALCIFTNASEKLNRMKSVSQADLLMAAMEKGILTEQDWEKYQLEKNQEDSYLRARARMLRSKRR